MLKKVMIKITSKTLELENSLFERLLSAADDFEDGDFNENDDALKEALMAVSDVKLDMEESPREADDDSIVEICTEGRMRVSKDNVSITYDETELTGMEGAKSMISFNLSEPTLVSMLRTGCVSTAMVFEESKRHICTYTTPYMPFELCVRTMSLKNRLLEDGELELEYVVEIRGSAAEHTRLNMKIHEIK